MMYLLLLAVCVLTGVIDASIPVCRDGKIQPQRRFNVTAFMGEWRIVADYNVQGKAFSNLVEPTDMHWSLVRKKDGSLAFKTGAHLTFKMMGYELMSKCFKGSGHLEIPDPLQNSHWQMAFDTLIPYSPASYIRDYYILSTDYQHYAILYTCYHTVEDGSCHPASAFAWVLSRHHKGHGHKHWQDVSRAARRACLDPSNFRDRSGPSRC